VHPLLRILGIDDLSGPWYGFWSGIGSDLAYLGILWAIARRGNCHVHHRRRRDLHRPFLHWHRDGQLRGAQVRAFLVADVQFAARLRPVRAVAAAAGDLRQHADLHPVTFRSYRMPAA